MQGRPAFHQVQKPPAAPPAAPHATSKACFGVQARSWDVETASELGALNTSHALYCLAASRQLPDVVALAGAAKALRLWDMRQPGSSQAEGVGPSDGGHSQRICMDSLAWSWCLAIQIVPRCVTVPVCPTGGGPGGGGCCNARPAGCSSAIIHSSRMQLSHEPCVRCAGQVLQVPQPVGERACLAPHQPPPPAQRLPRRHPQGLGHARDPAAVYAAGPHRAGAPCPQPQTLNPNLPAGFCRVLLGFLAGFTAQDAPGLLHTGA